MFSLKLLMQSFVYAWEGLWFSLKHNQNLRIHFAIAIIVTIFGILLGLNGFEKGIVEITILLVIVTEMINSVIEEMVDLITTEHRQQAKIAKDVGAGMVLVTAIGSVIVGILVFGPHILQLLNVHY